MPFLVEKDESGKFVKQWPIEFHRCYIIGRNPEKANIVISQAMMSRTHAMVEVFEDKTARVRDLGSANGTFVNGDKLHSKGETEIRLTDSFEIRFGENPNLYRISLYSSTLACKTSEVSEGKTEAALNSTPQKDKAEDEKGGKSSVKSKKIKVSKWDEEPPNDGESQEAKAKQAAMAAAAKITGPSGLTVAEKRKLLWSKKPQAIVEPDITDEGDNGLPSGKGYEKSFEDSEKQHKFLRLMGHDAKDDTAEVVPPIKEDDRLNAELEKQYWDALKRKDGRKTGLGL